MFFLIKLKHCFKVAWLAFRDEWRYLDGDYQSEP